MNVELPDPPDAEFEAAVFRIWRENIQLAFRRAVAVGDPVTVGGGARIKRILMATATWNPASLPALGFGQSTSTTTTTVTVTGASLTNSDLVLAGFSEDLQGMQLTGYVSAANTVTVVLNNPTGNVINLASGTLRVCVIQF